MSMPSPFELGQKVSSNISGAFEEQRDRSSIDQILETAFASGGEDALNTAMRNIVSRVSPDRQQVALGILQNKQKDMMSQNQNQQKMQVPINALNTMESLLGQPGIGTSGTINYSSKARQNRGLFQSSEAALLPIFKSMFPRGITDADLARITGHYVPQVGDTEANIRGKLQGLRQMLKTGQLPDIQNQNAGMGQQQQGGQQQNVQGTIEMRDAQGNIYDIPFDLQEQAKSKGLQ